MRKAIKGFAVFFIVVLLVFAFDDFAAECPLCESAENGNLTRIEFLLDGWWFIDGANPNATDEYGNTALMVAAKEGHAEVAETLLSVGVNLNAVNNSGDTALMSATQVGYAAWAGHTEVINALLSAGANPNVADKRGNTALVDAVRAGRAEIVEALLSAGANPNVADKHGNTALVDAVRAGRAEIVEALLSAGANPNAANDNGETALYWAESLKLDEEWTFWYYVHSSIYDRLERCRAREAETFTKLNCPIPPILPEKFRGIYSPFTGMKKGWRLPKWGITSGRSVAVKRPSSKAYQEIIRLLKEAGAE